MYNRVGQVTRGILDTMQEETDGTIIIFTHAPIIDAIIRYMLRMLIYFHMKFTYN